MKRKILVVFLTLNFISLLSCFDQCDEFEFFDYSGITVDVESNVVLENDSLFFGMGIIDIEYMSIAKSSFNFGYTVLAAIDCDRGDGGAKFPLTRIDITSDVNIDANHPANSSLNDIISTRGIDSNGDYVFGKVSDFNPNDINTSILYLSLRPEPNQAQKITLEIEKSNGEVLSATSEQIIWE